MHLPVVDTGESPSQAVFLSEDQTTLLECVFVQPTANHIPLRSDNIGNRPVDIDGCKADSAEVLECHTVLLSGHVVPLC